GEEVAQYGPDALQRLRVKPGLTGLWQVSGRSDLDWAQTVRLDLKYVDNWSVLMDLTILCRTFGAVLGGSGASCQTRPRTEQPPGRLRTSLPMAQWWFRRWSKKRTKMSTRPEVLAGGEHAPPLEGLPKVSAIIATGRQPAMLRPTLSSIAGQDYS